MKIRWWTRLLATIIALATPALGLAEAPVSQGADSAGLDIEVVVNAATEAMPGEVGGETLLEAVEPAADGEVGSGDAAMTGATEDAPAEQTPASAGDGAEIAEGEPGEKTEASATDDEGGGTPSEGAPAEPEAPRPDLTLGVGEQWTLEGGSDYASDRPDVVSVDAETGALAAMAVGTARITALGAGGDPVGWTVAVLKAPRKLTLSASKLTLGKGARELLTVSLPANTASARITFESSNPRVASVNRWGKLKAKKTGTAVITVRAFNGAKAKCKVKVVRAPSRVKLSASKLTLCLGEAGTLKATLPRGSASPLAWSSDDAAVAAVDGSGNVIGVSAGTATVTVTTFNGKQAGCTVDVLAGSVPTALSVNARSLTLGKGESYRLTPMVGEGECATFSYTSNNGDVAAVSPEGVITGAKKGTATVTVRTHNGLSARVKVKVRKAPASVALSRSSLSMRVGETAGLSARTPEGTASGIAWSSSDEGVAAVDAAGNITALKEGVARITASTFNGKTDACEVRVSLDGPSVDDDTEETDDEEEDTFVIPLKEMTGRLRSSGALGAKREAIANVVELLIRNGFEATFAAGVGANVYAEGTYGLFESSRYVTYPMRRPRYFCYLDGGEYYTRQGDDYALTAVYLSQEELEEYDGEAEPRLRFGEENFYLDNYSRRNVQDVNLTELENLMERLAAGNWEGKFGLGIVQWTGSRTRTLVSFYRKHAGSGDSITAAQVVAAENEMILSEFKGGYKGVYTAWKQANRGDLASVEAAQSAGAIVCTRYEIPADKGSKAVARGSKAAEIYRIMIGG